MSGEECGCVGGGEEGGGGCGGDVDVIADLLELEEQRRGMDHDAGAVGDDSDAAEGEFHCASMLLRKRMALPNLVAGSRLARKSSMEMKPW